MPLWQAIVVMELATVVGASALYLAARVAGRPGQGQTFLGVDESLSQEKGKVFLRRERVPVLGAKRLPPQRDRSA